MCAKEILLRQKVFFSNSCAPVRRRKVKKIINSKMQLSYRLRFFLVQRRCASLLDEKAVWVSAVFRPKDGEDERKEDRHDGETYEGLDATLSAHVGAA